jgi:carbohydrate kinase (thermoresistant glucokinase family)
MPAAATTDPALSHLRQARFVVMGVSGCGKSTLAQALAQAWDLEWVEGDALHAQASVAKMRAGIPLQDDDRWPWLDRVGAALAAPGPGGRVITCSALKRSYRDRLRAACPGLIFLFLDAPRSALVARMAQREGHFMPGALLDSQLATLEAPGPAETDVVHLEVEEPTPGQVDAARRGIARQLAMRAGPAVPGV